MPDYKLRLIIEGDDKASRPLDSVEKSLKELANAADKASDRLSRVGGSMDDAGKASESFGNRASSSFQRVAEFAGGALIASGIQKIASSVVDLTEKAIGLGVSFVQASNEINAGMANVASLNVPTEHITALKAAVQSLAIESGKDTKDLTAGLYQVVSAFGDTADTAEILGINTKAAVAGVASTVDAINLTSAVTKGYGDTSAAAVTHVTDLALKSVELGQTTFPELASAIGKVVPLSQQLGITQNELFAVMATGAGVTGTTSDVATQYRGILQSIMAPTETMTNLTTKMGFKSSEAMLKQFGLSKSIEVIVAASKRSGIPLQQFIGSIEGQTLAMALAGPLQKNYANNLKGMENAAGKTDDAFKQQTDGVNKLGFKLGQAGKWWQVFKEKAGDAIGGVLLAFEPAIEPFLTKWAGQLEAFLPKIDAWATDAKTKVAAAFSAAGGGLAGAVAGLGAVTGGKLSVEANVVKVNWGEGKFTYTYNALSTVTKVNWGTTTYAYNATAQVLQIDWLNSREDKSTFLYNAKAGIIAVNWNEGTLGGAGIVYSATAGIISVDWKAKGLTYSYNASAKVTTVDFGHGLFTGKYTATANVTNVLWGLYTNTYNVGAKVEQTNVAWGIYTHIYDGGANITSDRVAWGAWSHYYNGGAKIEQTGVLWGAWTHTYASTASVTNVLWGVWAHTYDSLTKISETNVLWGAWSHYYDASAKVGANSVLWGAWSVTYDVNAKVGANSVLWGLWSTTYDAKANVTSWTILGQSPEQWKATLGGAIDFSASKLPAWTWPDYKTWSWPAMPSFAWPDMPSFAWPSLPAWTWPTLPAWSWPSLPTFTWPSIPAPAWLSQLFHLGSNASGTANWRGGWTWVGERGPELLNLPAGSQILSNTDSRQMIGHMADGNTAIPAGLSSTQQAGFNRFVSAVEQGGDKAGKKIEKAMERAGNKLQSGIEAALSKVPGLFAPSTVTAEDMALGDKYKPKVDELLRQVQSAASNEKDQGRFAPQIAQAREALQRIGVDVSGDIKVMAAQLKQAWSDQSLFSDKANLSLLNTGAIQDSLKQQAQQVQGKANILQLFGIQPDQAQAQALQAGIQISGALAQGMAGKGGVGTTLLAGLTKDITPEALAPVSTKLTQGLAESLGAGNKDQAGGVDYGAQFATAINASLATSTALDGISGSILTKITDSFKTIKDVDFIGGIVTAFNLNLAEKKSIDALKNVGGKIAQILKLGIDDYFKGADVASGVANGVKPPATATTTTTTVPVPANAAGTNFWRGGLTWVNERGGEIIDLARGSRIIPHDVSMAMASAGGGDVHNHYYTVNTPLDLERVAYQVSQVQRRRRG